MRYVYNNKGDAHSIACGCITRTASPIAYTPHHYHLHVILAWQPLMHRASLLKDCPTLRLWLLGLIATRILRYGEAAAVREHTMCPLPPCPLSASNMCEGQCGVPPPVHPYTPHYSPVTIRDSVPTSTQYKVYATHSAPATGNTALAGHPRRVHVPATRAKPTATQASPP